MISDKYKRDGCNWNAAGNRWKLPKLKKYSNYHIHWIRARELYLENKQEFATTKKLHKQNLLLTMKIEVDQSGIRVCFIWHLIGLSFVLRNAKFSTERKKGCERSCTRKKVAAPYQGVGGLLFYMASDCPKLYLKNKQASKKSCLQGREGTNKG